jgi:hypothetical protein
LTVPNKSLTACLAKFAAEKYLLVILKKYNLPAITFS